MTNPYEADMFKFFWDNDSPYNETRREEIIAEDPPNAKQTAQFVADAEDEKELIDRLYFIYKNEPITNIIGWDTPPKFGGGIGGFLELTFYDHLYEMTKFKAELFPYLPEDVQSDEMLIYYLENAKGPKITNYHGFELSPKILDWIVENQIGQIKFFKPEWWTPKLKTAAIKKSHYAIAFIPEDLLTKTEVKDFLRESGVRERDFLPQLWKSLPDSFKKDPEIFALWLTKSGGLKNNYKNIYTKDYYTFEGIKKYYEIAAPIGLGGDWSVVKQEWKKDLIDIALPKVKGAIAKDETIELTNSILDITLNNPIHSPFRGRIASRLHKEGRLTPEILSRLKLTFEYIEYIPTKEYKALMQNEDVIDHFVKSQDVNFFARKTNWPKNITMKKEHIIDLIVGVNFSYSKIKARIKHLINTEDDYLWLFFEANKYEKEVKSEVRIVLRRFTMERVVAVSKETSKLLKTVNDETTFESFTAARDIFIF